MAGGRLLSDGAASLAAAGLDHGCSVTLLLRLAGGKGGFGALLRGQGRDGKITDNFDACRDLSGRRIRHVEAEKKLKQWQVRCAAAAARMQAALRARAHALPCGPVPMRCGRMLRAGGGWRA